MAIVHEQLYRAKDFSRIDLNKLIEDLITNLFSTYGVNPEHIIPKINVQNGSIDINTAIPVGLIINELVSNSLKHAFPSDRRGSIHIECYLFDNKLKFLVSDDGIGFPQDINYRETESMGLLLVNTLIDQLHGSIELDTSGGTKFMITITK
jgi:two-component sensor histidine kinase